MTPTTERRELRQGGWIGSMLGLGVLWAIESATTESVLDAFLYGSLFMAAWGFAGYVAVEVLRRLRGEGKE